MPFSNPQQPLYEIKANLFKGVAHPVRIRVLELLAATPEVTVSDLISEIGIEASHLSQHLAVLRKFRLVESERRASYVFYRLADPAVANLLAAARTLLMVSLQNDSARLSDFEALPSIGAGHA